jgi:hypothetical protein
MNCRAVELLLPFFVGGDVDATPARHVREHLMNCEHCRTLERGLGADRAWLASEQAPFGEKDFAAVRRGVWREIEASAASEGAFRSGRLALAGAAALAAALIALLWLRPLTNGPAPAAPITSAAPSPVSVAVATPQPPVEEPPAPAAPRPVGGAPSRAEDPVGPRPAAAEGVPVKIEFQTANPNVRIIWLVKKGEAAPGPLLAGRNLEVS